MIPNHSSAICPPPFARFYGELQQWWQTRPPGGSTNDWTPEAKSHIGARKPAEGLWPNVGLNDSPSDLFLGGARTEQAEAQSDLALSSPLNDTSLRDDIFEFRAWPTPTKAVALLAAGLGLSLLSRPLAKAILPPSQQRQLAKAASKVVGSTSQAAERQLKEQPEEIFNIWYSFNKDLIGLTKLAIQDPKHFQTLAAFTITGGVGALVGAFMQGLQETWVRLEETKIRARLLNRMKQVLRGSIAQKDHQDLALRAHAKNQIRILLTQHGIAKPERYLNPWGLQGAWEVPESVLHKYFYEPTHRELPQLGFGQQPLALARRTDSNPEDHLNTLPAKRWLNAGLFATGVGLGEAWQGFLKLYRKFHNNPGQSIFQGANKVKPVYQQAVNLVDLEAVFAMGMRENRPFLIAILFGTFAAQVGRYLLDGLRQIEVTRMNATTEYRYQKHNWLSQDPAFHQIAEESALATSLQQLRDDMPYLKQDPERLRQRVQTILTNVGRNSAPKYFPMTPMVNLVEARG